MVYDDSNVPIRSGLGEKAVHSQTRPVRGGKGHCAMLGNNAGPGILVRCLIPSKEHIIMHMHTHIHQDGGAKPSAIIARQACSVSFMPMRLR